MPKGFHVATLEKFMSDATPSWIGRTIGGRYKVETLLGRGGMSSVYQATDPNLQRTVAVKIIHPHLTDKAEFIQRFKQEAAAVAQLRHPNIIQVHDFNSDRGICYMVLEYVPGETLANKLEALNKAGLRMPLVDTVRILAAICDAVDYAHQRRMIHRDLKPANVMVDLLGEPILMDFGIAKILGNEANTDGGAAIGTAVYMSPEQVRGETADHRADIYSLGVMLYELLSGVPPFQGDSTYEIMMRHLNDPVPDIHLVDSNTPHALVNILERALSKTPDHRYQTASEMAAALRTAGLQLQSPADTLAARHLDRLSFLWMQARDLFDERDFAACIDKLDELKRTDGDHNRERVSQLRQDAVTRLYERAMRLFDAGKYDESLVAVNLLNKRAPEQPGIDALEKQIRQGMQDQALQMRLDKFYEEAVTLVNQRAYEQALQKWQMIWQAKPSYLDEWQVEKRAKEGICNGLYTQAISALALGNRTAGLEFWQRVLAVDPTYPDSQQIVLQAGLMVKRQQRRRFLGVGLVILLVVLIVGGMWILREQPEAEMAVSPTPVAIVQVAPTHTPSPTTTHTPAPTKTAVPPSSTPTSPPTHTATPQTTATISNMAIIFEASSLFAAPATGANELGNLQPGEQVTLLGRSANNNWLYVRTAENITGYISAARIEWAGDIETLAVQETAVFVPTPTSIATSPVTVTSLELDLWVLPNTVRCQGQGWQQTVFIQGRGGNNTYTYFWNDEQMAGPLSNQSFTFDVSSGGGAIAGIGKVVSGDGQTVSQDLFIPRPTCGG